MDQANEIDSKPAKPTNHRRNGKAICIYNNKHTKNTIENPIMAKKESGQNKRDKLKAFHSKRIHRQTIAY